MIDQVSFTAVHNNWIMLCNESNSVRESAREGEPGNGGEDMPHANLNHESFGLIDIILFVLLAADLCALAYVFFTINTLMVIMFSIVSGVTSVLFLVWVMGKLENRQKEIDALSSRVDIAEQEKAAVTEELRIAKERLVTTRKQRDDSTAKVKTTTKTNKQRQKDVNALKVSNAALDQLVADNNDKVNRAKGNLFKERANHSATKDALHLAEQKIVVLAGSLANVTEERDSKSGQLAKKASEHRVLVQAHAALEGQLDVANHELAVKGAKLDDEQEENAVLAERLANNTKMRIVAETKLQERNLENGALVQRLAAANEKLAAKDAVIAAQRFKIAQGLLKTMDQGKVNALLRLNLEKSLAQLQGFHFHSELHLRSAEITKKTVARLQNKVEELQCSMVTLQLSASTPSHAAAATSAKDDATAAIPDDSSTGTVSTTLSPSPSGSGSNSNSSSVSRTSSGISTDTSNSDDHAIAQPVVASASVIPTLQSPSSGGAAPAGCHAGPHDRPKRDKRNRRGQQHDGKTRSSAKATKRKQEGLWRGYS